MNLNESETNLLEHQSLMKVEVVACGRQTALLVARSMLKERLDICLILVACVVGLIDWLFVVDSMRLVCVACK